MRNPFSEQNEISKNLSEIDQKLKTGVTPASPDLLAGKENLTNKFIAKLQEIGRKLLTMNPKHPLYPEGKNYIILAISQHKLADKILAAIMNEISQNNPKDVNEIVNILSIYSNADPTALNSAANLLANEKTKNDPLLPQLLTMLIFSNQPSSVADAVTQFNSATKFHDSLTENSGLQALSKTLIGQKEDAVLETFKQKLIDWLKNPGADAKEIKALEMQLMQIPTLSEISKSSVETLAKVAFLKFELLIAMNDFVDKLNTIKTGNESLTELVSTIRYQINHLKVNLPNPEITHEQAETVFLKILSAAGEINDKHKNSNFAFLSKDTTVQERNNVRKLLTKTESEIICAKVERGITPDDDNSTKLQQ
ncbi:MAG: hypothetical protein NTZ67_02805 [Gammaproteobacteria bacterium]|nr:hypothetical protein [Gammaproteobacteria bacterium]